MRSSYSVRIPTPAFADEDGLEQLAQFTTPDGVVAAYWIRSRKEVVLEYKGVWTLQSDGNVLDSVAEVLGLKKSSVITVQDLFFFEKPGHGKLQDDETHNAFYMCDWSDYACDRIAIQADLTYPYVCS